MRPPTAILLHSPSLCLSLSPAPVFAEMWWLLVVQIEIPVLTQFCLSSGREREWKLRNWAEKCESQFCLTTKNVAAMQGEKTEREKERRGDCSPALVALPKSAALITLNWPAPNNVTTVKCNIKIFRTFILGLSPSLHFPLVPALPISLPWPDRQMPKKRKMATKWNLPAAHTATTTKQQQRGNNFHKAKHLLYLPNGVWKQARN